MICDMRAGRFDRRTPLVAAAQIGQAAWLFGNLYEAAVGMPQLLADAREHRQPGLMSAGSPVRYFAPVAPLALGATAITLVQRWRSNSERPSVSAAAAALGGAVAISGYLIHQINLLLLRGTEPLTASQRRQFTARWHRLNAVRLALIAVVIVLQQRSRSNSS